MALRGFFISPIIGYYEGDQQAPIDTPVSRRPDTTYDWTGNGWVENPGRLATALGAAQVAIDNATVLSMPAIQTLVNSSPAQIQQFITQTVVDLPSARQVLLTLALIVRQLAAKGLSS